jgi:hypothetical protein
MNEMHTFMIATCSRIISGVFVSRSCETLRRLPRHAANCQTSPPQRKSLDSFSQRESPSFPPGKLYESLTYIFRALCERDDRIPGQHPPSASYTTSRLRVYHTTHGISSPRFPPRKRSEDPSPVAHSTRRAQHPKGACRERSASGMINIHQAEV